MWRFSVVGALVSSLAVAGALAQEPARIGVFDFGKVTQQTLEGLRIQKQLREFQEKKQTDLAGREKELRDLQDQLMAQALSLSPEKRAEKEKEIQKKQNDLQTARESAQREWQIEFNEAQSGFQAKVINIVESMGREGKFLVIFERDQCVFSSDTVDITPSVIERLNKMNEPAPAPSQPPAPAPQQPSPAPPAGK